MATTFGRYTLLRKLATGGMAEVFLARADGPMGFQKKCVVKRILPHFSDDPSFVQMFLGEARLAAELNHPNLVQIFDFGEVHGQYFIAMEYIEGPNLRVLNRELRVVDGPIPLPLAARIITLAAEGLQFAHDLKDEQGHLINLVHRDISPDNILVSKQGAVKVVDFGIAKAANQPHLTKSGMIKGKLAYMPPEQLAREPLDRRSDIYALGVVLYELVCGEMPFDATSEVSIIQAIMGFEPLQRVRSRRPDVPEELDAIIACCLEKDPANRFPSCRALQQDLERFVQSSGVVVAVADLAAIVERTFQSSFVETLPHPLPDPLVAAQPLDPTIPRVVAVRPSAPTSPSRLADEPPNRQSQDQLTPAPPPVNVDDPLSRTQIGPAGPQRRGGLLIGGFLLAAALVAAGAFVVLHSPAPTTQPQPLPVAQGPDAAAAAVATEVIDSGRGQLVVDAGLPPDEPDAGKEATTAVAPPTVRMGRLELRVRPYASVSIDGRPVGDTPLPVQTLSVGKHKVRLINTQLEKDVVLEVNVHPGENVLKHNFKE